MCSLTPMCIHICVCLCMRAYLSVCIYMSVDTWVLVPTEARRQCQDALTPELLSCWAYVQGTRLWPSPGAVRALSCWAYVQGTRLWSSPGAVRALSCWAISQASRHALMLNVTVNPLNVTYIHFTFNANTLTEHTVCRSQSPDTEQAAPHRSLCALAL